MPANPKNTRKCIVCREHSDKAELMRIVKRADGTVVIDKSGKAGGRGVYLHAKCVEAAIKKRALNAAFKCNVKQDVYDALREINNLDGE